MKWWLAPLPAGLSLAALMLVVLSPTASQTTLTEITRIRRHLEGAEALLARRDLSALTSAQRAARTERIADLRDYVRRGAFPHNHQVAGRTPVFVDEHGTRCAMAHLIDRSGGARLVRRIASTRNLARIRELSDDAELAAWLARNGLTLAEAARIQPAYDGSRDPNGPIGPLAVIGLTGLALGLKGTADNLTISATQAGRNGRGVRGVGFGILGGLLGVSLVGSDDGLMRALGVTDVGFGLMSFGLGIRQLNTRPATDPAVTIGPVVWTGQDGEPQFGLSARF